MCDRIAIIKDGKIVSEFKADELKQNQDAIYAIGFADKDSYNAFKSSHYTLTADSEERMKVKARVPSQDMSDFVSHLSRLQIQSFHQVKFSLEDYFMDFYKSKEVQE